LTPPATAAGGKPQNLSQINTVKKHIPGFGLIQLLLTICIAIILATMVTPARAQQYTIQTLNTGTNVIAASGSLTPTSAIVTATKNRNVALQMSYALSGTGTAAVTLKCAKSVDGIRYETVESGTLAVTASGTNTVSGTLNVDMGAAGYLKVTSITNANDPSTVAGLTVKAVKKPNN
jgi:Tfp pilus assembly protein FimT